MLIFMSVIPAILMRNERHFGRFRNSVFGLLLIVLLIVLQRLCAVYSLSEI